MKDSDQPEKAASFFNRLKLIPDPSTPKEIPSLRAAIDASNKQLAFHQTLPFSCLEEEMRDGHPHDHAFRLSARISPSITVQESGHDLEMLLCKEAGFLVCLQLEEGLESVISHEIKPIDPPTNESFAHALSGSLDSWNDYWSRSGVILQLPNGTCTDKLLQSGGRYSDTTAFDYMGAMGIWFENFALPAVINECLMQSYNGILRFFPNWSKETYTEFAALRAVGGFLVSAVADQGDVLWIDIYSEAGSELQIYNPWEKGVTCIHNRGEEMLTGNILTVDTVKGEHIRLLRA